MLIGLRHLVLGLALGWLPVSVVQAASVVVLSSESGAAYAEAAQALIGELEKRGLPRDEVLAITTAEWTGAVQSGAKLIVTLGVQASERVAQSNVQSPVLCTLLPLASFERLLRAQGRRSSPRFTALYLDQPFSRQLTLIRQALPKAKRVGVLWGPASAAQAPAPAGTRHARTVPRHGRTAGHPAAGWGAVPGLRAAVTGGSRWTSRVHPEQARDGQPVHW